MSSQCIAVAQISLITILMSAAFRDECVCAAELEGVIVDASSGQPVAARLYIADEAGKSFFASSKSTEGQAVTYDVSRSSASFERHTSLSAHPFVVELPPGKYQITVERGKEYRQWQATVSIGEEDVNRTIRLQRWIDLSALGWYSGETHVHRPLGDLPTLMLSEDLNVAFPLTYWVTQAYRTPKEGNKGEGVVGNKRINVDPTHVIHPLNTEYEIFTVNGQRHTLGAIFAIGHQQPLEMGAPPVAPIANQVRQQGGLLELDKHNWPWSMMLVPIMKVDLYELTNNHLWRTDFHFRKFGASPPDYMHIERDERGMTESGWIQFTLQNYYALLNCGFRLRPTAGTASGVHPVPLGFGRVYVHLERKFSYEQWLEGLNQGRSFVTTGPMTMVQADGLWPGKTFVRGSGNGKVTLSGSIRSQRPLSHIEIVVNGEVVQEILPANQRDSNSGYEFKLKTSYSAEQSYWIAVRCFESTDQGRVRFAHTGPWYVEIPNRPIRPRKVEVQYLIGRMEEELMRHQGVLTEVDLAEYQRALQQYREIAKTAR